MKTPRRTYWITDARQIRALASVARQEIVDAVTSAGPCTIAVIAETLGVPPDRLYFHVRRLMKVGLLVSVGKNGKGREEASLYDLPGRPLRLGGGTSAKGGQRAVGEIHDGIVRLARRDIRRAARQGDVPVEGPSREFWVGRVRGWLTPVEIRKLNGLIEETLKLVREGRPRAGARPIAFSFVLAPPRRAGTTKLSKGVSS